MTRTAGKKLHKMNINEETDEQSLKVNITTLSLPSQNACSIYGLCEAITVSYFLLEYVLYISYCQLDFPGLSNQRTRTWPSVSLYSIEYLAQSRLFKISLLNLQTFVHPVWNTALAQPFKSGKILICQLERAFIKYLMEEERNTATLLRSIKKYGGFISERVTTNIQRIKEREEGRNDLRVPGQSSQQAAPPDLTLKLYKQEGLS